MRNTKKNVARPTIIETIIDVISNEITVSISVVRIVPKMPINKHFKFLIRHFSKTWQLLLQPSNNARIIIYKSANAPIPKAIHIPFKIRGVSPIEKSIAIIIPATIPKIVPAKPHPHLQLVLLVIFIFITPLFTILCLKIIFC